MASEKETALRTKNERLTRLSGLLPLLACPKCGGALALNGDELLSYSCGSRYPIQDGIPILLPLEMVDQGLGGELGFEEDVSMHPYSPASVDIIHEYGQGWVLDLGAGGKHIQHSNVVQIDVFRFPMTDVVASADCLPFRNNVFDAVISQAVFEHLQYPEAAASEVWRVLKPDGVAKIDTAFLQPEHAYPHHYFNATEAGLKHWFRDFELTWSGVEPYQHPKWALAWFLSVYFSSLPSAHREHLEKLSLSECVDVLNRLSRNKLTTGDESTVIALDALTPIGVRTLAAGVSVRAIKRSGLGHVSRGTRAESETSLALALSLERRIEQLVRNESACKDKDLAISEIQRVSADRTRYLLQFYSDSYQNQGPCKSPGHLQDLGYFHTVLSLTGQEIKRLLPQFFGNKISTADSFLQPEMYSNLPMLRVAEENCGLILVVHPKSIVSLLNMFFSLTHQSHGGWVLWICELPGLSMDISRLARELAVLDSRVRVVQAGIEMPESVQKHWVYLPHNCVLSFCAVFELVTLVRSPANYQRITGDVEHWADTAQPELPTRCYGWRPVELFKSTPPDIWNVADGHEEADPMIVYAGMTDEHATEAATNQKVRYAHVPKLLYRLVEFSVS